MAALDCRGEVGACNAIRRQKMILAFKWEVEIGQK